jgi:hypothetical protein
MKLCKATTNKKTSLQAKKQSKLVHLAVVPFVRELPVAGVPGHELAFTPPVRPSHNLDLLVRAFRIEKNLLDERLGGRV